MRWSYKTVHFAMKKEGLLGGAFLDETEIEQELNEFGRRGWELVSILETQDGVIAFFKQPLGGVSVVPRQAVQEDCEEIPEPREKTVVAVEDVEVGEEAEPPTATRQQESGASTIGAIRIE
jgi:hypothetical protein